MPKVSDLKKNAIVDINGEPHSIDKLEIKSPTARGGNTIYKYRFRNLITGNKVDKSLKGDDMVQEFELEKKKCQFLYKDDNISSFMDSNDYSQYEINNDVIEFALPYLKDNQEDIIALTSEGNILTVNLPASVELLITDCAPGVKNASATSRTKPATLETGLVVQVPEYVEQDDVIKVNTDTGDFLARV